MVKKYLTFLVVSLMACFFSACQKKTQSPESSKLKVVATTAMIAEVVKEIASDKFDVYCLIKGDVDPHSYELVKGDLAKLKQADVIFYQGLGLEHGATLVSYLKKCPKAVSLGDVIKESHPEALIYQDGYLDPHVWLDLELWQTIIPKVTQELSNLSPDDKEFFETSALELTQKMQALNTNMQELLKQVPLYKRYLVTSHNAFSYFTRRYISQDSDWQTHTIAPEGLAPEAQISLYDIEKVVAFINAHQVEIVFSESNVSKDALKKVVDVCKKMGRDVKISPKPLFGDALFDEKSYLDMMWHNATVLHQAWYETDTSSQDQTP